MRLPLYLAAILLLHNVSSEESSWSWGSEQKNTPEKNTGEVNNDQVLRNESQTGRQLYNEELIAALPSEYAEINANSTEAGQIIEEILSSTREGKSLEGFDEVYSDPNVQNALQNGDDGEARNIIKDRLCAIGLMQCDDVEEKRPYISPEDLIYAQPVAINAVGKPIPTIPLKGGRGVGYGPPKPLPYPSTRPLPPPTYHTQQKYPFPGSSNRFGNPLTPPGNGNYFHQGKPPRRQFSGPLTKPFYGKPGLNGEVYDSPDFLSKPPNFPLESNHFGAPIEVETPYQFLQNEGQHGQKDKNVEITVNTHGGVTPSAVEHVHHHYHHNAEGGNKPVIINPIPIASAAVSTSDLSASSLGNLLGTLKPSASASTSAGLGSFGSSGYQQGTYGGQFIAQNGVHPASTSDLSALSFSTFKPSPSASLFPGLGNFNSNRLQQGTHAVQSISQYGVKPIAERYPEQQYESFGASVGSFGSSSLYKKELNLNSGNNNYLQSNYADKYQGFASNRGENYDCVCVPYDQCPSQDLIGRKDDLYLPIDPRNLKTDIEALTDEDRVITDGNGTMTVIRIAKNNATNTSNNETNTTNNDSEADSKRVSKREAVVDAPVIDDVKPEARQRQYGSIGNIDMKKIKPTLGISFGLPQQGGGGYPVNPYGPSPFSNPYSGALGAAGINLGLVSVNPLVSLQLSKDDYGNKEFKPFINLHVTPNNYLIHKFEDLFAYKKAVIFNKHKHYHVHKGYPHYHNSYPHDIYREHPHGFDHTPHYFPPSTVNPYGSEEYDKPPFLNKPPPIYEHNYPPYPQSVHEPSYPHSQPYEDHHPGSYFDNPLNYGGGEYSSSPYYGRAYQNNSNIVEGNNILQQYQNVYDQASNDFNSRVFRGGKSLKINSGSTSSNPITFPNNRKRRDVENENSKTITKRQFSGSFNGQPQACGPRHVCCRRPLRPQVPNLNRQCGIRHSQGINGRIKNPVYVDGDSEFGEYPWQVAILKKDTKESVYVCGGTLIDSLHILTAAHCVKTYTGFDLRVRLGEWDVNHDVEFYPYIERDIVSVQVHPEFYAGTLYNDIAILKMDKPVDWSKYPHISPACLPLPNDDYSGTRCWTTGWGKDAFGDFGKYQNILKEVDVPVVRSDICQRLLQNTRLGYDFKLHPGFTCAGGEEGKDACKGDGGGPMVCERGGTWQVVGLVSWGIGCGQSGVPGVYVNVGHYLDWIRQITQRY